MTNVCGIITEYNPFHNGHAHHLAQSRRLSGADDVIAVMSGNFVQRGEPAIIDKYRRTRMALDGGVDIVLELPVAWATSSAEGFADGACRMLAATGIVDSICFGSEIGDIVPLMEIARHLVHETDDFKQILRGHLASGLSFPAARAAAVAKTLGESAANTMSHANNTLGIEYLKAILRHNLPLDAHTSTRYGTAHNSDVFAGNSASAGAIRRHIYGGGEISQLSQLMPQHSYDILAEEYACGAINQLNNYSPHLHYALHINAGNSAQVITKAAQQHYKISDILSAAKTKNLTHTALQRAAMHIVLGINPEIVIPVENNTVKANSHERSNVELATGGIDLKRNCYNTNANITTQPIPYIRILGFRREKEALLRRLHAAATVPVITNLKYTKNLPDNAKHMLEQELAATRMFWLGLKPQLPSGRNEWETPMVMV